MKISLPLLAMLFTWRFVLSAEANWAGSVAQASMENSRRIKSSTSNGLQLALSSETGRRYCRVRTDDILPQLGSQLGGEMRNRVLACCCGLTCIITAGQESIPKRATTPDSITTWKSNVKPAEMADGISASKSVLIYPLIDRADDRELGVGWDELTETFKGVKAVTGNENTLSGSPTKKFLTDELTSTEQIDTAQRFGFAISAGTGITSGSLTGVFSHSSYRSAYGLNLIVGYSQINPPIDLASPSLAKSQGAEDFYQHFGTHYVRRRYTGGSLVTVITKYVSTSESRDSIAMNMETSLGGWLHGNADYDKQVKEIAQTSHSSNSFEQRGGDDLPPGLSSSAAEVFQYIGKFSTQVSDGKWVPYALELASYAELDGAPPPPKWVQDRLGLKVQVAQRLKELGEMNTDLSMAENNASEFDPGDLHRFEADVADHNKRHDVIAKLWSTCVNKGPTGDAACNKIQQDVSGSWSVRLPVRPLFFPVNVHGRESKFIGAIPPGEEGVVTTRGTFNVWGPGAPGVAQDPAHNSGLYVSAVTKSGDIVYDGWFYPTLTIKGEFQGRKATVDVTVTSLDINWSDNCCDDFRVALVPVQH